MAPFICDVAVELDDVLTSGGNVLMEGAQGTHLDIDHGTYPFVTSSNPVAGSACNGAGVGVTRLNQVWGVVKAYTTRVGGGPFLTELTDATGEWLQKNGDEYGATTGRPRRCGWMDGVVVRHSVRLSGITGLCVTKLDVLTGLDSIKFCVGYRTAEGEEIQRVPASLKQLGACTPGVRGDARLERGHHRLPHLGRASGQLPLLPGASGGIRGRAPGYRFGGAGPRTDHRHQRPLGLAATLGPLSSGLGLQRTLPSTLYRRDGRQLFRPGWSLPSFPSFFDHFSVPAGASRCCRLGACA